MKRGQEVLQTTMLFEIISALLVAGILLWALFNNSNISFINQKYVYEDLEQLSDFIKSVPGDVQIDYPILITKALKLLSSEGVIFFSTIFYFNFSLFSGCFTLGKQ